MRTGGGDHDPDELVGEDTRTFEALRDELTREAEELERLQKQAAESERIERAQRALIHELRGEIREATQFADAVADRLKAAELELVDLRAVRDALVEPTLLQREGMTIAAEVIPAARHVGGDFFFVGDGPDGTTVMAVGDVVGHGLPAVRRSAFTRTALATVAPFSDDPGQLLQWVNVALVERIGESAEFVTAACATFHPSTRRLRLASAGHHAPLELESGTELSQGHTGAALGLEREIACSASTHHLEAGDGILFYTDGLTEARGEHARYGIDRLSALIHSRPATDPQEILQVLKRDLHEFAGDQLDDDVGLLILCTE